MTDREPTPGTTSRVQATLVAGLLVVVVAIGAAASNGSSLPSPASSTAPSSPPASSPSTAPSPTDLHRSEQRGAPGELGGAVPADAAVPRGEPAGALGKSDGVVPDGVTVFDRWYPAVSKLDPTLLRALRRAATDAAGDGVTFYVDSGWRSRKYQEQLFRQAVSQYGSAEKAARWVAVPGTSSHELGDAVDIGQSDATAWLSEHGLRYGLCQIYRNEPWHFELRPSATDHGCPRMYADPTHDPRMTAG